MKYRPTELIVRLLARRQRRFVGQATKTPTGGPFLNAWLVVPQARLYVRRASWVIDGQLQTCLDLASMEVREKYWRRGILSGVVSEAERLCPWKYVVVENVMVPGVADWLGRRGYLPIGQGVLPDLRLCPTLALKIR